MNCWTMHDHTRVLDALYRMPDNKNHSGHRREPRQILPVLYEDWNHYALEGFKGEGYRSSVLRLTFSQ